MAKYNLTVKRVKDGSFDGDDGERVTYFWVKAEDAQGVTIEFGTKREGYEEGEEVEVELDKTEKPGGKGYRYKEVL